MQRSFANLFHIAPLDKIESINGNILTLKSGYTMDVILTANNMDLNEKLKEAGANDYFAQTSKADTHPIDEAIRTRYRNTRVIVQLQTTQGDLFTWGSMELPVRVKINSNLKGDNWELIRKSPTPLFT